MILEMGDIKEFARELKDRKIKDARIFSSFTNDGYTTTFKILLTALIPEGIVSCGLAVGREYNIDAQVQNLAEKTKAQAAEIKAVLAKDKITLKPGVWKE